MIFQQGLNNVFLIGEIVVVFAQPRNRCEVFERPQSKMAERPYSFGDIVNDDIQSVYWVSKNLCRAMKFGPWIFQ